MRWEKLKMSGLSSPQDLVDAARKSAALARTLVQQNPQVAPTVQPVIPTAQAGVGAGGSS